MTRALGGFLLLTLLNFGSIHEAKSNSTVYYLVDSTTNNNRGAWSPHRINKKDTSGTSLSRDYNNHDVGGNVLGGDDISGYGDSSNYNNHYNGGGNGGATAFQYHLYPSYPAASNTYAHHHYGSPGYFQGYNNNGNGWNFRTTTGYSGGKGSQIDYSNFNMDEFMDNVVYGPLAQMMGLKGNGGGSMIKFGILFLAIVVPLLLLVTVPLSALVVILILSIPFPVWDKMPYNPVYKSLKDSTEYVSRSLLMTDECVERISCQISQFAEKYGKDSWISRIKTYASSNTLLKDKISRGFSKPKNPKATSSCVRFSCDPVGSLKKALKI